MTGSITLGNAEPRSRTAQATAGGADRRLTDEDGHYIAYRFNGPRDALNHFAQDRNFNRSGYAALENQWIKAVRSGKQVKVDVVPSYPVGSKRPSAIDVTYTINGKLLFKRYPNQAGGK